MPAGARARFLVTARGGPSVVKMRAAGGGILGSGAPRRASPPRQRLFGNCEQQLGAAGDRAKQGGGGRALSPRGLGVGLAVGTVLAAMAAPPSSAAWVPANTP